MTQLELDIIENKDKIYETPTTKIVIREDGILHIHIKSELNWEIEESRELFETRKKIANGKKYPILYTGNHFVIPSSDVRRFVSSQERNELVVADAYVYKSLPQKIIGNFYIKFDKPIRPTRMFTDIDKAIEWLATFV